MKDEGLINTYLYLSFFLAQSLTNRCDILTHPSPIFAPPPTPANESVKSPEFSDQLSVEDQ